MLSRRLLRNFVLLIVITNCFEAAGLLVLFQVYAAKVSPDAALLATMVAFFAGGALCGASMFSWFGHRLPRLGTLAVSFLLAGAPPYFAMAIGVTVPVLLTVFALAGLAAASINPLLSTLLYERVPQRMRARVPGAMTTGFAAAMPIGSLLGGLALAGFWSAADRDAHRVRLCSGDTRPCGLPLLARTRRVSGRYSVYGSGQRLDTAPRSSRPLRCSQRTASATACSEVNRGA